MKQKVFRVEQMIASQRAPMPLGECAGERDAVDQLKALRALGGRRELAGDDVRRELTHVHEMVARNRDELAALIGESKSRRMARATGELGAAVDGMEKATHAILQAAEAIDDSARSLKAAFRTGFERGLAQDIQDHAVDIYEACNFQDLAGQRIAKVIGIMQTVEEQLAAMLARCSALTRTADDAAVAADSGGLINGPRLDGDSGHAGQSEIDALFG